MTVLVIKVVKMLVIKRIHSQEHARKNEGRGLCSTEG